MSAGVLCYAVVQVPDVLIDPSSVTRCFRITKQIGMLATGLPGRRNGFWSPFLLEGGGAFSGCHGSASADQLVCGLL